MPQAEDVVDLDNPGSTEPNFQEPEGLTLEDVDDNFEPIAQTEDTPSAVEDTVETPWWEDHLNDTITVKVDGKDVDVPLDEARKGYMRQQDYTKKTTEAATLRKAAEWGQAMQHQLKQDPVGTLSALAQALGIGFNPKADPDLGEEVFDSDDAKWAQRLSEYDERLSEHDEEIQIARMQRELYGLAAKYGDDFDAQEVLTYVADQLNETGVDVPFEQAFLVLQGQKTLAERQKQAKRAAAEQARKKSAAQQVTRTVNPANAASRSVSHQTDLNSLDLRSIFNRELEGVE